MHPAYEGGLLKKPRAEGYQVRAFLAAAPTTFSKLSIHGIGVREWMPPGTFDRPLGTGDYLIMGFHHEMALNVKGQTEHVPGPSVVVWTPGQQQLYASQDRFLHSWLHVSGEAFQSRLAQAKLPENQPIVGFDPTLLEHCLLDLYRELFAMAEPDESIAADLLGILLRRIARATRSKEEPQTIPQPFLALRQHLDEYFAERVTLAALARRIPCSVPHLCAEFKRYFDIAPIEYIVRLRLHVASMLLADRSQNVGSVARAVGYPDANQFSRLYRKHYGVSPSEARPTGAKARRRKA